MCLPAAVVVAGIVMKVVAVVAGMAMDTMIMPVDAIKQISRQKTR